MDVEFNLVFRGEVALDHDESVTRQRLAKAFKASDDKLAQLFSGKPVVIKKGLSPEDGIKLQRQMLNVGAITYLEPASTKVVARTPRRAPSLASRPSMQASLPPMAHSTPAAPTLESLALVPLHTPAADQDAQEDAEQEEDMAIERPAGVLGSYLIILIGLILMAVFSPYPDWVLRKGFAIGAVAILFGMRRLKNR